MFLSGQGMMLALTRMAFTVRFHTVSQAGSGVAQPLAHPGQNPSFGSCWQQSVCHTIAWCPWSVAVLTFHTPQLCAGPTFVATTSATLFSHALQSPSRPGQTEHMLVSLRFGGNAVQFAAS